MKKYILYISTRFFSSRLKQIVTFLVLLAILAIAVFHDPHLVLMVDHILYGNIAFLELFLLTLAIMTSAARIRYYVKSPEYLYLRTLPISRGISTLAIISSTLPTIALYLFGLMPIWSQQGWKYVFQFFYTILLILSLSTMGIHILLQLLIAAGKSKKIRYTLRALVSCSMLALFVGLFSCTINMMQLKQSGVFIFMQTYIMSANPYMTIVCILWLALFRLVNHTYDHMTSKRRMSANNIPKRIFKGMFLNILYKDFLTALTKVSYISFSGFLFILGVYLLSIEVPIAVHIVWMGIVTFFLCALSEELMKDDIINVTFLRTLPIQQRRFFWMKILSVFTIVVAPSVVYWVGVSLVASLPVGTFMLTLIGSCLYAFLISSMQCIVIFANLDSPERRQIELTLSVMLSILLPVIPIYYILVRARKAKRCFCGGRQ